MLAALLERLRRVPAFEDIASAIMQAGPARVVALGAVSSLLISVLGTAISFALQVILARTVGERDYGVYVVVLGWMNVALIVSRVDMDVVATRFVGTYVVQQSWSLLRGFVRRARQIVFFLSAIIGMLGVVALFALRGSLDQTTFEAGVIVAVLLPVTGVLLLSGAILQGLKDVPGAQAPNAILRPGLFMIGVLLARQLSESRITATDALLINLAATAFALGVSWFRVYQRLPVLTRGVRPAYNLGEWVRTGAWFVLIDLFQLTISQQSDVLVIGALIGTTAAGHYGAASQYAALVQFGTAAVMFMATPFIAELYAQNRLAALQRLVRSTVLVSLLLSVPVLLGLIILGHWLLRLFGHTDASFETAFPALVVLGFSQLVVASVGMLAGTIMSMTGHQRTAAKIIGGSAAFNLALSLLLTPRFGLVGAAVATLAATVLRSATLAVYIRRVLSVSILPVNRGTA